MMTDDERRNRVIDVFNDCLQAETSLTLDSYWNRDEYEPAFTTIIGDILPDPSAFHTAIDDLLIALGSGSTDTSSIGRLWTLVYGSAQP